MARRAADFPAALQTALDVTAEFIDPALEEVLGEVAADSAIIDDAETPESWSAHDPTKPIPGKGDQLFLVKAPRIMEKLIEDFGLAEFQAAGILGNIGHECAGFRHMQEKKPLVPGSRGGFGWAQWTASRRDKFEAFCNKHELAHASDAANFGYLKEELNTSHRSSIDGVKATNTLPSSANIRGKVRESRRRSQAFRKQGPLGETRA